MPSAGSSGVWGSCADVPAGSDHPSAEDRRAMLADPTRVVSLDDHVALYTLPASLDRLAWQLEAGPPVDAYPSVKIR